MSRLRRGGPGCMWMVYGMDIVIYTRLGGSHVYSVRRERNGNEGPDVEMPMVLEKVSVDQRST